MPHATPSTPSPHGLRRRASLLTVLALSGALLPLGVQAQTDAYPAKPITLVVGYPPGGSTDLMARVLGPELSKRLGTPVVIENLGGAGGAIGAQKVANATPDGYTLLVGANNEIAIKRLVAPTSVKYELKDFTPLGLIASQPMVLVASTKTGVTTLDQFVKQVKANPGKYSYGSSGVGTALHLAGEMVKDQAGVFMTHIPYRGVAPLTNDLLGNNLEFGVFVLSSGLPHIKAGKVVALGTTERKRSASTPDVPALSEHPALKNIDIASWFALMGPARLPEPVVAKLKKALTESLQAPELRKKLEDTGSTLPSAQVDLPKFLVDETAKYKKIVEFAHIQE